MTSRLTASCLLACLVVCAFGCDRRSTAQPQAKYWGSNRETATRSDWLHHNYYEQFDKYPGYGIAVYYREPSETGPAWERAMIIDSLRQCREEYGPAYRAGTIERTDARTAFVPFNPKHIAVVLENLEHREQEQAGGVFDSSSVFDPGVDLDDLVPEEKVQRGVLWRDDPVSPQENREGYSPAKKTRFQMIERHMTGAAG